MPEEQRVEDVSVIISHYNKAKFLEPSIFSAINQTIRPKEVIVVDDSSSPNQQAMAEEICEKFNVSWIVRKTNGGPSITRNDGIKASTGKWIQILDADDCLTNNSIEVRLNALKKSFGATLWITGQFAKAWCFVTPLITESKFLKKLFRFNIKPEQVVEPSDVPQDDPYKVRWHHGAILYHRSLFQKYGLYDEMVRLGQDKELRWRFWYFSQTFPLVVNEVVYIFRQGHRGRLTSRLNKPRRMISRRIMMANMERRKLEGLTRENTKFL